MSDYKNMYDRAQKEIAGNEGPANTSNWSDHDRKTYEAARAQAERDAQAARDRASGKKS